MAEVQKAIAIGEIEEAQADAFEAGLEVALEEVGGGLVVGRWRVVLDR